MLAADAACAEPAHPGHDRATRRLRRLALHGLVQTERSRNRTTAAGNCNAALGRGRGAASPSASAAAASPTRVMRRDDRRCLAARTLLETLCDEPNAARCRATVRPAW